MEYFTQVAVNMMTHSGSLYHIFNDLGRTIDTWNYILLVGVSPS